MEAQLHQIIYDGSQILEHCSHLEGLLNASSWTLTPEFLSQQNWGGAGGFGFLTGFQVLRMQFV